MTFAVTQSTFGQKGRDIPLLDCCWYITVSAVVVKLSWGLDYYYTPHIISPEQGEQGEMKRTIIPDISDMYGFRFASTNDELAIWVRSPNQADIRIEIADLLGKTLINKASELNKGENKETININNLKTGVYLFSISINGLKYYSGKISIVR